MENMNKKMYKLFLEKKELEVQLNLENNYKTEAYENFKEYRRLAKEYLEKGFIKEKKYNKTLGLKIERWEKIFEPKEESEENTEEVSCEETPANESGKEI